MKKVILALAGGWLLSYFLDPARGRSRRALAGQRIPAVFRRRVGELEGLGRRVGSEAHGLKQKATHLREEPKDLNDPALARKVESEIFRDADVPKGQINVSARDGVVELRGEVPSAEMIEDLVERTRRVPEVQEVENLLHLPGSPAPTRD